MSERFSTFYTSTRLKKLSAYTIYTFYTAKKLSANEENLP